MCISLVSRRLIVCHGAPACTSSRVSSRNIYSISLSRRSVHALSLVLSCVIPDRTRRPPPRCLALSQRRYLLSTDHTQSLTSTSHDLVELCHRVLTEYMASGSNAVRVASKRPSRLHLLMKPLTADLCLASSNGSELSLATRPIAMLAAEQRLASPHHHFCCAFVSVRCHTVLAALSPVGALKNLHHVVLELAHAALHRFGDRLVPAPPPPKPRARLLSTLPRLLCDA
jgi:hypothetical protein